MEVAPRIAARMGMYRNLGVYFPLLSIYDAMELDVESAQNRLNSFTNLLVPLLPQFMHN